MCVSLLPAGPWHTPNLTGNWSLKAHGECEVRALDEVREKRGRYMSKVNYIPRNSNSEKHCGEGLPRDHVKVNGTIVNWKSLYCADKETHFFLIVIWLTITTPPVHWARAVKMWVIVGYWKCGLLVGYMKTCAYKHPHTCAHPKHCAKETHSTVFEFSNDRGIS